MRASTNVEDRRQQQPPAGPRLGGVGIGVLLVVGLVAYMSGVGKYARVCRH